jgi:hypothetical protein
LPSITGLNCYVTNSTYIAYCAWGLSCGSARTTGEQIWTLLTMLASYSLLNVVTVASLLGPLLETPIVYSPGLIYPQGYTTAMQ